MTIAIEVTHKAVCDGCAGNVFLEFKDLKDLHEQMRIQKWEEERKKHFCWACSIKRKLMKIVIRDFKESDTNFLLSAWIKSSYSNVTGYKERYGVFHKGMEAIIKKKYQAKELIPYVACLDSDEDLILGFAVFGTDYTLHYVFVKEAFKKLGICNQLLSFMYKNKKEIIVSHWCKDIAHIKKNYKVEYNRFKLYN